MGSSSDGNCAGGEQALGFSGSGATLGDGLGGSSPGSRLSSVVKKSPVRWRSYDCCFACLSSV